MCLSVSGRLRLRRSCSKGLSPDSSYRDGLMIHDMRQHVPRRNILAYCILAYSSLSYAVYPPDFFAGHPCLISSATMTSR